MTIPNIATFDHGTYAIYEALCMVMKRTSFFWPTWFIFLILLMVQKSDSQPPGMVLKPVVNNGINYQPQLVSLPDFWLPSTVWTHPLGLQKRCRCAIFFEVFFSGSDPNPYSLSARLMEHCKTILIYRKLILEKRHDFH